MKPTPLILSALCLASTPWLLAESFYSGPSFFSQRPDETKSLTTIDRFGPVGMAIDLIQPAFTMRIKSVEEGSPAAATGKLKAGQIIESINGEPLKDIDPRIQLGNLITKAEAADGVLKFAIKGEAEPVIVKIPALGAYSPTWPLNCPKSDQIVRNLADYIASPQGDKGIGDIGYVFLMSTGEEKDTAVVGEWARSMKPHMYPWFIGFSGISLCEYYLRTGDKSVLPNIQKLADNAVATQYNDAWSGRGGPPAVTYGNGHLNAGGTAVLTAMLLAKECGAEIPDAALLSALRHFYRYAGRGGNPYGDDRPEIGFVDNGKSGNLAFAMAAAAALTPDGEKSVYAAARDSAAKTSFYSTSFMLHGHTGGGIGEIWRSGSMSLLRDKKPAQYRDFMDNRRWHYELSRRFDGSFGILGGGGYDRPLWGVAYGWAYTVPRKQLRIFGAPPTKFSKPFQLPKQPWGVEADNEFLSLEAVPDKDGKIQDLSQETLAKDSSIPFLGKILGPQGETDEGIRSFIHHQDVVIREIAAAKALGINLGYIGWKSPGGKARPHLMMEFLQSPSPRVRRPMFSQIASNLNSETLPKEVFDLAVKAVADPKESWWVKDAALHVIGLGQPDWVVPHVDLLLSYLKMDEWWLRNAAMKALTPIAADERTYQKVIPQLAELIQTNQRPALTLGLMPPIREKIRAASPAVQQLAIKTLQESYTGYTGTTTAPGGLNISNHLDSHLEYIAASLADIPGGLDVVYDIARQRYPNEILPYKKFFLNADPATFGPKLKKAITPIITDELIPEYIGLNRATLRDYAAAKTQNPNCGPDSLDGLAGLHSRAGNDDYQWRNFVDIRKEEWAYHSFDPIAAEQVPFDQINNRYRKVTLPAGMENWYAADFDPDKVGWKRGKGPFGQHLGKIADGPASKCSHSCTGPMCYGAEKANTLWENEILLLRKKVAVPPLKEGHRYRLRVHQRAHVGNGGGFGIWVNGKPMVEKLQGIGRGGGEKPYGAYITQEWLEDFAKGEVTIAVQSFLRYNDKYNMNPTKPEHQGLISIDIEEQKIPPIGDDLIRLSAKCVGMLSSEWQAAQFSESDEERANAPKFQWDGKFVENPPAFGSWKLIAQTATIEAFDPAAKPTAAQKPLVTTLHLAEKGETGHPLFVSSGDRLMDLTRYQALMMKTKTIADKEYLFLEVGGFSTRNQAGWTSPWLVFTRE
jgi:hypothetical protein